MVDEDDDLTRFVSELRLVKDAYEIAQMRARRRGHRVAASTTSSRTSPAIIEHPRGERIVEGVFHQRARSDGNTVGYDTIAASGPHACYLHWTRNDGAVVPGDLILIDAGVEVDSLYTADITRTHPGQRPLHRGAAPGLRDRARGRRRGLRRGQAGGEVPLGARGGDAGHRARGSPSGDCCR